MLHVAVYQASGGRIEGVCGIGVDLLATSRELTRSTMARSNGGKHTHGLLTLGLYIILQIHNHHNLSHRYFINYTTKT